MGKSSENIVKAQFQQPFICSDIGDLLYHYIFELLSEGASEEVEKHLLVCSQCLDEASRMVTIEHVGQQKMRKQGLDSRRTEVTADVFRLADFKK